jgi:hypothetical protein
MAASTVSRIVRPEPAFSVRRRVASLRARETCGSQRKTMPCRRPRAPQTEGEREIDSPGEVSQQERFRCAHPRVNPIEKARLSRAARESRDHALLYIHTDHPAPRPHHPGDRRLKNPIAHPASSTVMPGRIYAPRSARGSTLRFLMGLNKRYPAHQGNTCVFVIVSSDTSVFPTWRRRNESRHSGAQPPREYDDATHSPARLPL